MEGLATNWNFTKLATNAPINQTPEQDYEEKSRKLEKLEIIGNNPNRKDNKEVYKLKIINPTITTKTQNLVYNLEDLVL